ncbi:MAG TPA: glycosyltransferase family 39 protein [Blastocatellia bacterium]|nr:glycosyltransferase family 39 protein [Blastocatellia bacterium]
MILIFLVFVLGSVCLISITIGSVETGVGLLVGLASALLGSKLVAREKSDRQFLLRLFFGALALRWLISSAVTQFGLRPVISPDATTYDFFGDLLLQTLQGLNGARWTPSRQTNGWGMYYYVAAVYYLVGRGMVAIEMINGVLGALTCVLVYKISRFVYPPIRVARLAGILAAVTPSLVLWSSQAIKEAPIMFCLALSAYLGMKICRRFDLLSFVGLLAALFAMYSLRHYAFVILFVGIAGALIFTSLKFSLVNGIQGLLLTVVLSITFIYFGADQPLNQYTLQRMQRGRAWAARVTGSGYGGEVDVSDTRAALKFLPIGILYVLFAPFPWMVKTLGQAIAVPETLLWWITFPLLVKGFWHILRRRLLEALPFCIFTTGLTLGYALYQTNAGTVHRQRPQLLIFFVIFVSVGWHLWQEARKEKAARRRELVMPPRPLVARPLTGTAAR